MPTPEPVPVPTNANRFKWLKLLLKVLVSLLLLGLLSRVIDPRQTLQVIKQADLGLLAVAVSVFLIGQVLNAVKWAWLGRALKLPFGMRTYLRVYFMGLFLTLFLPGSVGGDAGRAVLLGREAREEGWAIAYTVLADRYSGLMFLLVLSSLACVQVEAYRWVLGPWLWGLTVLVAVAWLVLGVMSGWFSGAPGRLGSAARQVHQWEQRLRGRTSLVRIGVSTLAVQCLNWSVLLLLATAIELNVSASGLMTAYGLVTLASLIPLSLNGLGIREGGYVLLLGLLGVDGSQALGFGVLWFAVFTFAGLLSGLAWWVKGDLKAG